MQLQMLKSILILQFNLKELLRYDIKAESNLLNALTAITAYDNAECQNLSHNSQ